MSGDRSKHQLHGPEDESPDALLAQGGSLSQRLAPYESMVIDLTLSNGALRTGVLITSSGDVLILEEWDEVLRRPDGNLTLIAIEAVARVIVR